MCVGGRGTLARNAPCALVLRVNQDDGTYAAVKAFGRKFKETSQVRQRLPQQRGLGSRRGPECLMGAALGGPGAGAVHWVHTLQVGSFPRPGQPLELYEFESCPFCRKVRAC